MGKIFSRRRVEIFYFIFFIFFLFFFFFFFFFVIFVQKTRFDISLKLSPLRQFAEISNPVFCKNKKCQKAELIRYPRTETKT